MTSLYTFILLQNFFIVEKAEKNNLYPLRSERLCGEYNIIQDMHVFKPNLTGGTVSKTPPCPYLSEFLNGLEKNHI